MSNYDNTNKGTLFKNDKGDNPKRPDYQGKINVNGKEMKLAAWIRTPNNGGDKFIAITVSDLIPKSDFTPKNPTDFLQSAEGEDDIPF
jgi:uncharacterized protein (DUF736 family)